MDNGSLTIIVGAIIAFCIFVLCREISCWYFKTTEIVSVLNEILKQLMKLNLSIAKKKEGIKE